MKAIYTSKILDFLTREISPKEFESWIYTESNLESDLDPDLYLILLESDYNDKYIVELLNKKIVENYISKNDFANHKLECILKKGGWYTGRKTDVKLPDIPLSKATVNAIDILEKFGGLTINNDGDDSTQIEFTEIFGPLDLTDYAIKKNIIGFAQSQNGYMYLYVDDEFNFYQIDDIVGNIYIFEGEDLNQLLKEQLGISSSYNFREIKKVTS